MHGNHRTAVKGFSAIYGEVNSMAAKAFVLIETTRGKSQEVNAVLRHVEGMISAEAVTPPYDIIAVAEGDSLNDIGDMVNSRIYSIDGVTRAVTCATMQESDNN
jgi:DNA-binding Lrp family transcriptional regulator